MNDDERLDEFRNKLIFELHDIALSLRQISGRSKVTQVETNNKPKSYAERYFAKSKED